MDVVAFLQVFVAAMMPVGELRISIPIGIHVLDLPWYLVLPISIIGNLLPVLLLVPALHIGATRLRKHPTFLTKILDWRAASLLHTHNNQFAKYGSTFLVLLVAVPLPMTGAWTGSLASWVFGIPARKSILLIAAGVVIAGTIVTLLTESGIKLGNILT
ncbi:uncharacterized protein METZ01_LOCUS268345 [marine metagenome]|uniref:Small multi-drug export protein n=1 Tax=marine metagenome TaxID=408172 RepID=A0A382JY92_9ZZZZ